MTVNNLTDLITRAGNSGTQIRIIFKGKIVTIDTVEHVPGSVEVYLKEVKD